MNEDFQTQIENRYDGNGWSRYQIMVLQQLDDHNKVLTNLNKEISELKQVIAVSDTELKMWRAQTMLKLDELTKELDHILYDEKGLSYKVTDIERSIEIEEQTTTKIKAMWALYGAVAVFLINIGLKVAEILWNNIEK